MKKDRREFFKITASSALGVALLPSVYYAQEKPESGPEGTARKRLPTLRSWEWSETSLSGQLLVCRE